MKNDSFYLLADKSLAGLTELNVSLGIAHCTSAELTTAVNAAKQKRLDYKNAVVAKDTAQDATSAARTAANAFIERTRGYLAGIFGPTWSPSWSVVGFTNQTLTLPNSDGSRVAMLELVKAYFTANASKESAALNVTAAEATARLTALTSARSANESGKFERRSKRDARKAAELALDKKLRCLWNELDSILDPLDARWLKFLDRIPGDPRVPEAVFDLSATPRPDGVIKLEWSDALRAARYKVFKQVAGTDTDFVLTDTREVSDAELAGVPAGAVVRIKIVATNGVGDAAPSEVLEVTNVSQGTVPEQAFIGLIESQAEGAVHLGFSAEGATSFQIWHKGPGDGQFALADTVTDTNYAKFGLAAGTHEYKVLGVNAAGAGPASEVSSVEVEQAAAA